MHILGRSKLQAAGRWVRAVVWPHRCWCREVYPEEATAGAPNLIVDLDKMF